MYAAKIDKNTYNDFFHLQIIELAKMFVGKLQKIYGRAIPNEYLKLHWAADSN